MNITANTYKPEQITALYVRLIQEDALDGDRNSIVKDMSRLGRDYLKVVYYTEIQTELTPAIVNEFVKKIIVHAPEKIDGKRFQKVAIVFNFAGEIHLPTDPQTEPKEVNKQEKTA